MMDFDGKVTHFRVKSTFKLQEIIVDFSYKGKIDNILSYSESVFYKKTNYLCTQIKHVYNEKWTIITACRLVGMQLRREKGKWSEGSHASKDPDSIFGYF